MGNKKVKATEKHWSPENAAKQVDFSRSLIYREVQNGNISPIKKWPNGSVRIPDSSLHAWLARYEVG